MARRVVTLLFTDLEESTRSWLADEDAMADALARHDAILRGSIGGAGGRVLKHTGDGMVAIFDEPLAAAEAAVDAQRTLRAEPDGEQRLRTRMAVHTGACTERDGDLFGPTVNRAARIMAAAHGGQVLVSSAVAPAIGSRIELVDLGRHQLRDLLEPEALHQIVIDDAGAYPPLRSLDSFDHNLPPQRTRLIGRDADVATVRDLLTKHRLVTLTGIGGVGKTRLALEVAAQELDARPGAVFADLAAVAAGEDVTRVVATAAGLPSGDVAALQRLLSNRPMLWVLDSCEHVLDACADLAEMVLDGCLEAAVLATSREPLGVQAERVWRVPSLTDRRVAVELFVERAASSGAVLGTEPAVEEHVAAICERLDGIPLAIELAASRTSHLSVSELAARLEDRFRLLTGGHRRAQPRHQTLQAMLDWSHDLLDEGDRRLLRQAAVFVGGFTLAAIEHLAGPDEPRVLERLGSLVDRSLVTATPGLEGTTRYRLLETVRLYALDRLAESGEAGEVRQRHVQWVHALLQAQDLTWPGPPPSPAVVVERDNVLAALEWVGSSGDRGALGRLATMGLVALGASAWVDEGWRHFGRADVEAALDAEDLARYLAASAATANSLGDFQRQVELARRARDLSEAGSETWRAATGLLANALSVYDPPTSTALYEELLSSIPPDRVMELAYGLARSADPALMSLDLEEGARRLDEAERVGGFADLDLALPHLLLGRLERVREVWAAIEAEHAREPQWTSYRPPLVGGLLAAVEGRTDDATLLLVESARRAERVPVHLVEHDLLHGFAALAHHLGDHQRAAWLLSVVSTGPVWTRSPGMYALHLHYRGLVRPHVDRDEVQRLRTLAGGTTVSDVLREELGRHGPVAT